ncbi:MAG: hypothetical protein ACK6A5_11120 [Flavobacteriales bacterium]
MQSAGEAFHIRKDGSKLYPATHRFVHVFHKGFAVALDTLGWCHIDRSGQPIHAHRFQYLEPFYNGVAVAIDGEGRNVMVNEVGEVTLLG